MDKKAGGRWVINIKISGSIKYFDIKKKASKIYILDNRGVLDDLSNSIRTQKLVNYKSLLKFEELKEKSKDKKQINTQYIASVLTEENFKELIDEYLGKIILNG